MQYAFFTLPFFLLAGSAAQGFGLYVFAIIIPLIHQSKQLPKSHQRRYTLAGLSLITAFSVFPIANWGNYLLQNLGTHVQFGVNQAPAFHKLFRSQLSSAVFGSGVFLLLYAYFCKKPADELQEEPKNQVETLSDTPFALFSRGLLIASLVLGCYIGLQHVFGFDYRHANFQLGLAKKFSGSDTYRSLGFYGHPLSLAGACLGLFSFYFHLTLSKHLNAKEHECGLYLGIALLHFLFVVLSGGRFALLLACSVLLLLPLLSAPSRKSLTQRLSWLSLSSILAVAAVALSGMGERFAELTRHFSEGQIHRLKFWQVYWHMIEKKPWTGFGATWLSAGAREHYYRELGFVDLAEKYNAHNLFLEILANIGILGACALAASIAVFWNNSITGYPHSHFYPLRRALTFAFWMNLLNGLTQNTYFDSNVMYVYLGLFWVLLWNLVLGRCKTHI